MVVTRVIMTPTALNFGTFLPYIILCVKIESFLFVLGRLITDFESFILRGSPKAFTDNLAWVTHLQLSALKDGGRYQDNIY